MCLAVPGKIISIDTSHILPVARVDFRGVVREVAVPWRDMKVGDSILVHAGVALSRIDKEEAEATWRDFEEIASNLPADE